MTVRSLTPVEVKGLEFDLVVLVDPERFGPDVQGAVDRYVAMTRATHQLVILTTMPVPAEVLEKEERGSNDTGDPKLPRLDSNQEPAD